MFERFTKQKTLWKKLLYTCGGLGSNSSGAASNEAMHEYALR